MKKILLICALGLCLIGVSYVLLACKTNREPMFSQAYVDSARADARDQGRIEVLQYTLKAKRIIEASYTTAGRYMELANRCSGDMGGVNRAALSLMAYQQEAINSLSDGLDQINKLQP
jgi:hypothetical protein